ncbi:hypothetical protein [Brevibacillus borstelensis]|uniref:hypothetical protein n=1 Tax=Brevibacillus borstelensis TaxID=45462 RepID=UPI002E2355B9|nr:hypothetical protein [Brevibacillus borstelensis]
MESIGEFFVELINLCIAGIGAVLTGLIMLFPQSPFSAPAAPPAGVDLGYITWVIDFPTMLTHFGAFLAAVITYYGIRVIARWIKMVRS